MLFPANLYQKYLIPGDHVCVCMPRATAHMFGQMISLLLPSYDKKKINICDSQVFPYHHKFTLFWKIQRALSMCFLTSLPTIKRVAYWPNSVSRLLKPKFILQKVLINSNIIYPSWTTYWQNYHAEICCWMWHFTHNQSANSEYSLSASESHVSKNSFVTYSAQNLTMLLKEKIVENNLSRRKSKYYWKISRDLLACENCLNKEQEILTNSTIWGERQISNWK